MGYQRSPVAASKSLGRVGPPAVAPMNECGGFHGISRAIGCPRDVTTRLWPWARRLRTAPNLSRRSRVVISAVFVMWLYFPQPSCTVKADRRQAVVAQRDSPQPVGDGGAVPYPSLRTPVVSSAKSASMPRTVSGGMGMYLPVEVASTWPAGLRTSPRAS